MVLTLRLAKGSAITAAENDANFTHVLARGNHTGTQLASTISNFDAAVNAALGSLTDIGVPAATDRVVIYDDSGSVMGTSAFSNFSGGGGVTVVDNLTSTSSTDALSAGQGKVLDDKITALPALLEAADITARDALTPTTNSWVFVDDASADATVGAGWAVYRWDGVAFIKISEQESVEGGAGATNLGYTASPTDGTITSSTGTDATLPVADGTNAGLMEPADKDKVDFITVTQAVDLDTIETDVAASKTVTDFLTVTQAVDLDALETRVNDLDATVVLRGGWDASAGTFPGGGTAQAGDSYQVTVAGTVDGVDFVVNDRIIALVDNASSTTYSPNWLHADYTDVVGATTLNDLTDVNVTGVAQGDLFYHDGTNWVNLAAGPAGQALISGGAGANPSWQSIVETGSGAPASTPTSLGQIYIDTDVPQSAYISVGTGSSADWVLAGTIATGDGVPPVFNSMVFNGTTFIFDLDITEATSLPMDFIWATSDAGVNPTFDGTSWTGVTYETGVEASVPNGTSTFSGVTATTPYGSRKLTGYARDASGEISLVITEDWTHASTPDAFIVTDWSSATGSGSQDIDITIATLPTDNGDAITDVEYTLDGGGTWTSIPSYAGTGTYSVTMAAASTAYNVRIRAVNARGGGATSDLKVTTSSAAGDVTAPVIVSVVYNSATDQFDCDIIETESPPLEFIWATSDTGVNPTFDGTPWTGAIYENGIEAGMTPGSSTTNNVTGTTPSGTRQLTLYARDSAASPNTSAPYRIDWAHTPVASAFAVGDWSGATGSGSRAIDLTITAIPDDSGSAITDIEYDIDGSDTWISLGTTTTGTISITMAAPSTAYDIRLRAVNANGNSPASDIKNITSNVAVLTTPVFVGDFANLDTVTLDAGKTYAIVAAGHGGDMTTLTIGGDAGTVHGEHSFAGRRACVMSLVTTTAHSAQISFSNNPSRFGVWETGGRAFSASLTGPNGNGGPNLSINTNAGDLAVIGFMEFGDATHTWTSPGITWRFGETAGAVGPMLADKLVCAGGTPEAFQKTDNGVGLSSIIGIFA